MYNHFNIAGLLRYEVVDKATSGIIYSSPEKHNLILNSAFDMLNARSFAENVQYCAVGAGTQTPQFTQTGLSNEVIRTNVLDTSVTGYALTTLSTGLNNVNFQECFYDLTRVFKVENTLFPLSYPLSEIGWSPYAATGSALFSKTSLSPSVSIPYNAYLRVYYTLRLSMKFVDNAFRYNYGEAGLMYPLLINGWPSTGGGMSSQYYIYGASCGMQMIGLRKINSDGSLGYWDAGMDANEPCASGVEMFLSNDARFATGLNPVSPEPLFPSCANGSPGSLGLLNDTELSFPGTGLDRSSYHYSLATGVVKQYWGGGVLTGVHFNVTGAGYAKIGTFGVGTTGYFGSIGYGPSGSSIQNNAFVYTTLTCGGYPISYGGSPSGLWFIKESSRQLTPYFITFVTTSGGIPYIN